MLLRLLRRLPADPFGLRRAWLTAIYIIFHRDFRLDLKGLIRAVLQEDGATVDEHEAEVLVFCCNRLRFVLQIQERERRPGPFRYYTSAAVIHA